jgi:hypothetical protein
MLAFLTRHRMALAISIAVVLVSSSTAAAVSYLVLGSMNMAGATTTLKSGTNGAVLQLTNTNGTGGINARGLGITVPAGRPPMTVNSGVKVTNLNADKLDGSNSSAFARGTNITVLANRLVLSNGDTDVPLLILPGLGQLNGWCDGPLGASIYWKNTTSANVDVWTNAAVPGDGRLRAAIKPPGQEPRVALWDTVNGSQFGDTLVLGQGNSPGARRTATVNLAAFRTADDAPCGLQATATLWSTP